MWPFPQFPNNKDNNKPPKFNPDNHEKGLLLRDGHLKNMNGGQE